MFDGIITALITPINDENEVDFLALKKLIVRQASSGIRSLVIGGSTGEGSCLAPSQYVQLVEKANQYAQEQLEQSHSNNIAGKINIIAAISSAGTEGALNQIQSIAHIDIDGIMCTAPYYTRPEQSGLFQHFKAINDAVNLPLMLYIHPGRTGCDFSDQTLEKIMKLKNFAAIKDASSDLNKPLRLLPKLDINMLTGDDGSILSYYANGGTGCVSVISNIFPKLCKKIDDSWKDGAILKALTIQREFMPMINALGLESNPITVKYAMYKMGLCGKNIMLPLTFATESTRVAIDAELERLKIVEENS